MAERRSAQAAFGRAVRALREEQRLTQEEAASRCSVHWTYLGGIERGQRNPTLLTLLKLADGLGVEPSRLVRKFEKQLKR